MNRVRVALFVDVLKENFDGVSNTMNQILRRLPHDEIDTIAITPHPPDGDIGIRIHRCPYAPIYMNKGYRLGLPALMNGLEKILDDFNPDIIHWTSPSLLGAYALKYAEGHQLPVITIYHTHYPTYASYYLRFIPFSSAITRYFLKKLMSFYHRSSVIFAPTQTMRDYLVEHGQESSKVKIWGRGVDMTTFNVKFRDPLRFKGEIKEQELKVLFVSRLVKEKETDTLIRLHDLIQSGSTPMRLIITGDGPDRRRMEKKMPEAVFTGKLRDEALSVVYASCDVFVFPSVTETFGNVVLEAMASGLPVIAADAGGPGDIIRQSGCGFLVPPREEQAFYDKVLQLKTDKALYDEIRRKSIEYATLQSWNSLCHELFDTYKSLARVN